MDDFLFGQNGYPIKKSEDFISRCMILIDREIKNVQRDNENIAHAHILANNNPGKNNEMSNLIKLVIRVGRTFILYLNQLFIEYFNEQFS